MEFFPIDFIRESNRIEGIHREPTGAERGEFDRFMAASPIAIDDLVRFVSIYQPDARLRVDPRAPGVRVGEHIAPPSGPAIGYALEEIMADANRAGGKMRERGRLAHSVHIAYETLHPFTDGNGRSGRMLWMWMMRQAPLGFLHHFYYQTLAASNVRA